MLTKDEFIEQINTLRSELIGEVISFYQRGDRERGDIAYDRWKEQFYEFLGQHVPKEAKRFRSIITRTSGIIKFGEHPHETFMRNYGNKTLAFLDELAYSVNKGRIVMHNPQDKKEGDAVEILQNLKNKIDNDVESSIRLIMIGMSITIVSSWLISIVLWIVLGWDVVEPYTFYVPLSATAFGYAYLFVTLREFVVNPKEIHERLLEKYKRKAYEKRGFDIQRYMSLIDEK